MRHFLSNRPRLRLVLFAAFAAVSLSGCPSPASDGSDDPTDSGDYTSSTIGTLAYVPAGRFQRDAAAGNITIITAPYRMSASEITDKEFDAIFDCYDLLPGTPAISVNWYQAIAFCNKLSLAEGLDPVYSVAYAVANEATGSEVDWESLTYAQIPTAGNTDWNNAAADWSKNGYRLPTEMEWMWAAMGAPSDGRNGGTDTTGYLQGYAGSTEADGAQADIDQYVCYADNATGAWAVDQKMPNGLGLYDMSGNVWEWCWGWYGDDGAGGYNFSGTVSDVLGASLGIYRTMRGGCYSNDASECTVAYRNKLAPSEQNVHVGFRVVRR